MGKDTAIEWAHHTKPGPAPHPPRDGDKVQARQRVNVEVRTGYRQHPNAIPCADCGHRWKPGQRRHEYDHYLGYASEHHLHVESVCTWWRARRARKRAENVEHNGFPEAKVTT